MTQSDTLDGGEGAFPAAAKGLAAVDLRQHDVFEHGAIRQQVKRLEHEADAVRTKTGALLVGQ